MAILTAPLNFYLIRNIHRQYYIGHRLEKGTLISRWSHLSAILFPSREGAQEVLNDIAKRQPAVSVECVILHFENTVEKS